MLGQALVGPRSDPPLLDGPFGGLRPGKAFGLGLRLRREERFGGSLSGTGTLLRRSYAVKVMRIVSVFSLLERTSIRYWPLAVPGWPIRHL